jgi:hypothetical protein
MLAKKEYFFKHFEPMAERRWVFYQKLSKIIQMGFSFGVYH